MEEWVTLKIYTHPHDAYAMISKLEFEGIACQLKDENTLLAHNFLSAAIGGAKLQVRKSEYDDAVLVLHAADYMPDVEVQNTLLSLLDNWSSRIPLINRIALLPRVIGLGATALTLLATVVLALLYVGSPDGLAQKEYSTPVDRLTIEKDHFFTYIWPIVDSLTYSNPKKAIALIDSIQPQYVFHQMTMEKGDAYFALRDFKSAAKAYTQTPGVSHNEHKWRFYMAAICYDSLGMFDSAAHYGELILNGGRVREEQLTQIEFNMYRQYTTQLTYYPLEEEHFIYCYLIIGRDHDSRNELFGARKQYLLAQKMAEGCMLRSEKCAEQLTEVRRLLRSVRKRMAAKSNDSGL